MAVDLVARVPGRAGGGAQDQPLRDLHPALRPQADALLTWRVVAVRGRHSRPMNPDQVLWGDVVDVEPLAGAPGLPMTVVFLGLRAGLRARTLSWPWGEAPQRGVPPGTRARAGTVEPRGPAEPAAHPQRRLASRAWAPPSTR